MELKCVYRDKNRYIDTLELLRTEEEKLERSSSTSKSDFLLLVSRLIGQEVHQDEVDLVLPVLDDSDPEVSGCTIDQLKSIIHLNHQ